MRVSLCCRLFRSPGLKVLACSAFVYLIIFLYCRMRFWRDPHSAFFNSDTVYDWKYSLYREHEARHFISAHNFPADPTPAVKSTDDPQVCAAFVTVRRQTDDYFDASIGSLLSGLDPKERRALYLIALFANTDPTLHPSWGQPWLDQLVDSAEAYNVSEPQFEHLKKLETDHHWQEKGVFDYVYVLERCLSTKAPYVAVFEDDIIVALGWMAKSLKALKDIDHDPRYSNQDNHPWLYLRLFYTETFMSWSSSDFWYRNMPFVFASVMGLTFGALLAVRWRFPPSRAYLDFFTIGVVCFICLPAFIALVYMVGKYSLLPLEGLIEMDYGCCTQGLVFSRDQVGDLITHLRQVKSGQTDLIIEKYAEHTGLRRFALAQQQLQHVGLRSSRGLSVINTQSTWAFWFEENDPRRLKLEHDSLLQDDQMKQLLAKYANERVS
ncbi:hypothetical protein FQN57_001892 [Myotisia sp. PD_48]|nr:hypothetical protein FQN57_001892 [Myotisia sp. PD_48]